MSRRDGASLVPLTSQGPRRGGVSSAETPLDPPASPQLAAPPVPGFARDAEEGIQEGAGGRGGGPAWAARALHLLSPSPAAGGGVLLLPIGSVWGWGCETLGRRRGWGGGSRAEGTAPGRGGLGGGKAAAERSLPARLCVCMCACACVQGGSCPARAHLEAGELRGGGGGGELRSCGAARSRAARGRMLWW